MNISFSKSCGPLDPPKAMGCQPLRTRPLLDSAPQNDMFVSSKNQKTLSFGAKLKNLLNL